MLPVSSADGGLLDPGRGGGARSAALHKRESFARSSSRFGWLSSFLRRAGDDRDARMLAGFIVVSVGFMCVELAYGLSVNSLGLVSDGFHMGFHCIAMTISLFAMTLAHKAPTFEFSYGFDRHEVLAAFSNAMFLTFVCFFLWIQALHRIMYPVDIEADQLTLIGMAGLAINMVGLFLFRRRGRLRGGVGVGGASGGASGIISRLGDSHGAHTTNMGAIYIHLLADAASSVGVVISSLLVRWNGWMIADPALSFIIASVTLYSVVPLFRRTGRILLQTTPETLQPTLARCRREVATVDGVLECNEEHFWSQAPGVVVGSIFVRVRSDASEQSILKTVHRIFSRYVSHLTVQVEKDPPLDWLLASDAAPQRPAE